MESENQTLFSHPDIDTRIIDPMRKAKQGLQISLFSNLTHPGLFVAGGGTVIPPGTHTDLEVSLFEVRKLRHKRVPCFSFFFFSVPSKPELLVINPYCSLILCR